MLVDCSIGHILVDTSARLLALDFQMPIAANHKNTSSCLFLDTKLLALTRAAPSTLNIGSNHNSLEQFLVVSWFCCHFHTISHTAQEFKVLGLPIFASYVIALVCSTLAVLYLFWAQSLPTRALSVCALVLKDRVPYCTELLCCCYCYCCHLLANKCCTTSAISGVAPLPPSLLFHAVFLSLLKRLRSSLYLLLPCLPRATYCLALFCLALYYQSCDYYIAQIFYCLDYVSIQNCITNHCILY